MTITPPYAGLLALLFVWLSVRVIAIRRTAGVGLGDGGSRVVLRRQRVQANFAEYVPIGLVLMALAELQGVPAWALHAIGMLLLAGRVIHAYGLGREPEPADARVAGMALTFTALVGGALANLAPHALAP